MSREARQFRTEEGLAAERATRDRIRGFLRRKGFRAVSDQRVQNGQTITATTPAGEHVVMRVRLCWRRGRNDSRGVRTYSAAQLRANAGVDVCESLRAKFAGERERGITHALFVQPEDGRIVLAALIPLEVLVPLWTRQRNVYARLIRTGRLGRRTTNPADNGNSPTLYLQDDRAPDAAAVVWDEVRVLDVARLPTHAPKPSEGAGFGDPAENRQVEEAAVGAVTALYQAQGWAVRSVESERCGYDLQCRRKGAVEHVEVKGVRGTRPEFILTRGELTRASVDDRFVLMVVTSALAKEPTISRYLGREFIERFECTPVQFRAALRK